MNEYHKIHTVFKRDPATKHRTLLMGEYALPEFEYLKDNMWLFTEKVDGTNIRVIVDSRGDVECRGKTDYAQLPPRLAKQLDELFPSQGPLAQKFPSGATLYGEGHGAGIQKGGGNYSATQEFVLFDSWVEGWWLEQHNVDEVAETLGIKGVPLLGEGTLADLVSRVQAGFKSEWGDFLAEGIVARPTVGMFGRSGARIITKLKRKDFPHD